jgi:hypothetical protein
VEDSRRIANALGPQSPTFVGCVERLDKSICLMLLREFINNFTVWTYNNSEQPNRGDHRRSVTPNFQNVYHDNTTFPCCDSARNATAAAP